MYIVISIPNLKSTACGVSHFISVLLDSATHGGRKWPPHRVKSGAKAHRPFAAIIGERPGRRNAIIMKLAS
jgi:hypothetical protein